MINEKLIPEIDIFKFEFFSKQITVGANSIISVNMGTVTVPTGYSIVGVINSSSGVADQWLVSFGQYGVGSKAIFAMIRSKWGASLTETISCVVILAKTTYYTNNLI